MPSHQYKNSAMRPASQFAEFITIPFFCLLRRRRLYRLRSLKEA